MLKKYIMFLMVFSPIFCVSSQGSAVFFFRTGLFEHKVMSLSDVEKEILDNVMYRKLNNWFFIDTRVHDATLQAIHAYNKATPEIQAKSISQMQMVLTSHACFLYSLFYWTIEKHQALVDAFIYSMTGERIALNQLDRFGMLSLWVYHSNTK